MNILITICARGGSKGIKNKNIRLLNGIPLIHYTWDIATEFARLHKADIQLSTDSQAIKQTVALKGYETDYARPIHLATDKAGKIDTIRDAWEYAEKLHSREYDLILDLDVSSPLRTLEDLVSAFNIISRHESALNLFSVNTARKNPYFNMVESIEGDFVKLVKQSTYLSRQEAPRVYELNASFYFYTRKFMKSGLKSAITDKSIIYEMPHLCFDLDEEIDFMIMEFLLKEKKLDFNI